MNKKNVVSALKPPISFQKGEYMKWELEHL